MYYRSGDPGFAGLHTFHGMRHFPHRSRSPLYGAEKAGGELVGADLEVGETALVQHGAPMFSSDAPGSQVIGTSGEGLVRIVGRNRSLKLYRVLDIEHPDAAPAWIGEEYVQAYPEHRAGLELPPWWGIFPVTAPFAAAETVRRNLPGSSRDGGPSGSPPSDSRWPIIALLGILGAGAVAIFLIYKVTKVGRPIGEKAGEAATKILASRYGAGGGTARRITRSTMLPPAPRAEVRAPPAPHSTRPYASSSLRSSDKPVAAGRPAYTLKALPEYEAYR